MTLLPIPASKTEWHALRIRIQKRSIPEPNSGCWLWDGAINSSGYGWMGFTRGGRASHRVSYEAYNERSLLSCEHVLHRCDVRCCVNPDHLFLGDNAANVADRVAKGRSAVMAGSQNPRALITAEQALMVLEDQRSHADIAESFGITKGAVMNIKSGKNWRHITGGRMDRRGHAIGSRAGGAKLTDEAVRQIRRERGTQRAIAARFGVCQMTVSLIKQGKLWRHVAD